MVEVENCGCGSAPDTRPKPLLLGWQFPKHDSRYSRKKSQDHPPTFDEIKNHGFLPDVPLKQAIDTAFGWLFLIRSFRCFKAQAGTPRTTSPRGLMLCVMGRNTTQLKEQALAISLGNEYGIISFESFDMACIYIYMCHITSDAWDIAWSCRVSQIEDVTISHVHCFRIQQIVGYPRYLDIVHYIWMLWDI